MKPNPSESTEWPKLPSSTARFLWRYICANPSLYLGAFLLTAAGSASGILLPWALGSVVRGATTSTLSPAQTCLTLQRPLELFCALVLAELLFGRLADMLNVYARPVVRQRVMRDLFHYLQGHDQRYLSDHFSGALAFRIGEVSQGVFQILFAALVEFWPTLVVLAMSLILLNHASSVLAGAFAIWAFLFVSLSAWFSTVSQRHFNASSCARSETQGFLMDSVTNLGNAKIFARETHERTLLEKFFHRELTQVNRANGFNQRVRWFQFGASAVLKAGALWLSLRLWGQGEIDLGAFVMATSLTFPVINETRNLGRRFLDFSEQLGAVQNGVEDLVRPHGMRDLPAARTLRPACMDIEFRHLHFAYVPSQPVFRDLQLRIPAGQKVGIVGRSGSGKSTFAHLLLRLYDPQQGSVRLGGEDIKEVTLFSLRQSISFIPQDPMLFHRSLRDNIRYGSLDASDAEVEQAARAALAHDFILATPAGYDTLVGERGVKLSGGQRQRIAIARALLKKAPVLILDEATSSLDSMTERAIQETIDHDKRQRTLIVIAHRLSTLSRLDRILVFRDGHIVEDGSHAELLELDGEYALLWKTQSSGEETEAPPVLQEALPVMPLWGPPGPRMRRSRRTG
ncbi:MAG TPA: ABC transporter ATP-binding protein [Fibrobacteraceae bacterium]|nr:ABC transporter ATP-binding protein [Fibrobacteraceae bacterium]